MRPCGKVWPSRVLWQLTHGRPTSEPILARAQHRLEKDSLLASVTRNLDQIDTSVLQNACITSEKTRLMQAGFSGVLVDLDWVPQHSAPQLVRLLRRVLGMPAYSGQTLTSWVLSADKPALNSCGMGRINYSVNGSPHEVHSGACRWTCLSPMALHAGQCRGGALVR
jgi:hypothetical protein